MRYVPIVFLFLGGILSSTGAFAAKAILNVYTNDSFPSKWGPGPQIKADFEVSCGCEVKFVPVANGAALLTRLKIEGKSTKADIALGLDSTVTSEAKSLGIFLPYKSDGAISLPVPVEDLDLFTPFDYGWLAFMLDSRKFASRPHEKSWPTTMDSFLSDASFHAKVITEDPRSSGTGLGLLLWLHALYGERAGEKLLLLKELTLATTAGWSDAYGMFTKGEAPFVLSYTTSEAYHIDEEHVTNFKAMNFEDGHYLQVEMAGILKTSKQQALAKKFLDFLLSPKSQGLIASHNWMYPVTRDAAKLPKAYETLAKPKKTLYLPASEVAKNRKKWIDEWTTIFKK